MTQELDLFGDVTGEAAVHPKAVKVASTAHQRPTMQTPSARVAGSTKPAVKRQFQPLAERMRPKTIDEVIGQKKLLGPGQPLRVAFETHRPHSMILWGPPGVGKTTLARLMADAFGLAYISLSAVLRGVKDIRDAVDEAELRMQQTGKPTLVFVDEVHRFNKSQQDAFLPHVESGLFIFVGATTENPSFEVNSALLSRAAVYVLEGLNNDDINELIDRAFAREYPEMTLSDEARSIIVGLADGDARRCLNAIEVACGMAIDRGMKELSADFLRQALPATLRRFDKGGENFYDTISALHKSVRGSDPDAALYWMCRMLDGGCDPRYIARRVIRMAVEDISLADPKATEIALNAADVYERLGSPEGELALAQAVVYLAVAPKSNAVYKAYNEVRRFVREDGTRPVPMYLRNAPTKLMDNLGYGDGYRYAHDEPGAYAAGEIYLPEGLEGRHWYHPTDRGIDAKIRDRMARFKALNEAAWAEGKGRKR